MKNSLLIEALEPLTKKERKHFKKMLHSPFFNQREDVKRCYDYLEECLWKNKVIPNKAQLFQQLYGEILYDDHKVRVVMSFLLKLLEQYFSYQAFTHEKTQQELFLAKSYHERKLDKHYRLSMKRAQQQLHQSPHRNALYYYYNYQFQQQEYRYQATQKRISKLNFQQINTELDLFYTVSKLRQACLMLSHQAVYKMEYQTEMLPEVLQKAGESAFLDIPAVAIYYHCYQALSQPHKLESFEAFKQILFSQGHLFPPEEQQDLFILGINFCTKRYNAGDENYLGIQFELYQQGLRQGYLLSDGQLSRFTFRNIVTLGLILKQYEWVESFIIEYEIKLNKKHRKGMANFCQARLEYSRKAYGKALELLQQSIYRDPLLQLSARTVIIKIFYETNTYDALEAQLNSLQTFLRRKRDVISYHYDNYYNMLKYTRALMEINPYERAAIISITKTIKSEEILAERHWLAEQANQLLIK